MFLENTTKIFNRSKTGRIYKVKFTIPEDSLVVGDMVIDLQGLWVNIYMINFKLFVMQPHADYFYYSFFIVNLINNSMFNIDPS